MLDTNAWVWSLSNERTLSKRARAVIAEADDVYVSPISFFEIAQKSALEYGLTWSLWLGTFVT